MKHCPKCNTDKPESEFYKHKKTGRLFCYCKECSKADVNARKRTPEGMASKAAYDKSEKGKLVNAGMYSRRHSREQLGLDFLKSRIGCYSCGNRDPFVLTFHHSDPSKRKFSIQRNTMSKKIGLEEEIEKCICLCFNCHNIAHRIFGKKCIIGKEQLDAIKEGA